MTIYDQGSYNVEYEKKLGHQECFFRMGINVMGTSI